MSSVRRFAKDLRHTRGWVFWIGAASLLITILTTYMAVFGAAQGWSGTLSAEPPQEPLSFLRVVDPRESIVTVAESVGNIDRSVLDEPGLVVLFQHLRDDARMFLTMPLVAFTDRWGMEVAESSDALAVVGTAPPFVPRVNTSRDVLLWGSIASDYADVPQVDDEEIFGHIVQKVESTPLDAEYITGSGFRATTRNAALVVMSTAAARDIGIRSPYSVIDVVDGIVCYCEREELVRLAERMSEAEALAGTGRSYFAVGYDRVVGPVHRSSALVESLSAGLAIGVFLSVWCLAVMAAQVFWQRRSHVYRVESMCGATETTVHLRAQMLIALSLSLPALAGFALVSAALRESLWPPPLPPASRLIAVAVVAALHMMAGGINAWRVHRLYRFTDHAVVYD